MALVAIVVGAVLVVSVIADLVNTLVTTTTSRWRWWMTSIIYRRTWSLMRTIAVGLPTQSAREQLLGVYAPLSVLLLLVAWVVQQVIGFGLIWWGLSGVDGADGLFDSIYYSGVVYFTLGFGEVVPVEVVPRVGALFEAFAGVLTTALVIGYLPALYGAYSERERKLMTLDDGSEDRIVPQELLLSRAPTAEIDDVVHFFDGWEDWVAALIETHSTFPMLVLFRSKHPGQNWITALGVLCDAALQCQLIADARNRAPYWVLRRSVILFNELTRDVDLADYRARLDETYAADDAGEGEHLFRQLYESLEAHGFELVDYRAARAETLQLRRLYDAQMEYLIDAMLAPRGFWGHQIGHRVGALAEAADLEPPTGMAPPGADTSPAEPTAD